MLVLPISMARSMDFGLRLQWNHISGINILQVSMLVFKNQRAVPLNAARPADKNLIEQLDSHAPAAQAEVRFPARPQCLKAGFFKLSIAPVEGLNQSQQQPFAVNFTLS